MAACDPLPAFALPEPPAEASFFEVLLAVDDGGEPAEQAVVSEAQSRAAPNATWLCHRDMSR
jgi:hypothetical protein